MNASLPQKRLFSNTAIRGRVFQSVSANDNVPFTPYTLQRIVEIWSDFCKEEVETKEMLLGGDTRTSTPMFKASATSGILTRGLTCVDTGIVPTPAINWGCKTTKRPGMMITGSHTPANMNGIKLIHSNGFEIDWWSGEQNIEEKFFSEQDSPSIDPLDCREIIQEEIMNLYLSYLSDQLKSDLKGMKVVIDVGNGAMTEYIPNFVREHGGDLITLNNVRDGHFPGRGPEPLLPESIEVLANSVRSNKADFGVAFDGDGDRAIFVDEQGTLVWGDKSLVLLASRNLTQGQKFVTPVSTASSLVTVASERYGFEVLWTAVGAAYVARQQADSNALVGGEQNGGIIWLDGVPARDGGRTFIEVLNLVKSEGVLSDIVVDALPPCIIEKTKIFLDPPLIHKKTAIEHAVREKFDDYQQVTLDGTRIFGGEGSQQWSSLIRFSTTENNVLRVFTDGTEEQLVSKIHQEIITKTKNILKSV
ncbi:MAG: hypothetical protein ACFFDT_12365 [Candidatus Hodarchaeota archaeon]